MVGFPGESEADFEETYAFCREAAFAGLHVFPYSRRPGTVAARPPLADDQVPEPVKRERARRLLALAQDLRADFGDAFAGGSCLCSGRGPGPPRAASSGRA